MKLTQHMDARQEQQFRERALLGAVGLLLVCLLFALNGWLTKDTHIVLQPPFVADQYEISQDSASGNYYKQVALSTAMLVGNINPSRQDFVVESVSMYLDSAVYREKRQALKAEAKNLLDTGSTISFEPDGVIHEKNPDGPDWVFVPGERTEETASGAVDTTRVTYEFRIDIEHLRPVIKHYKLYEGEPHTADWRRRQANRQEDA